ncbi:hypothetical protein GSI_07744 [Ganoderma sinense ZZ0214-1]|uniref:Uncharacterized protein n=1 Tax=Ganoderma sinense ZZ0214-1 TaxID=1077348 RepID=A0A2G8S8R1_9APHY|nr:hypothetical protein GSI_07692 [Ganoderma sinense ZZ0214-1]PIL30166.1 hypothetical protein GSI_07744 [Ganoderma sinense ZZ0214-1]
MYVPGVTKPSAQRLYRRKGGGGKGGAKSGSSGRSGSSGTSGNSGSSNSKGSDGVSGSTGSSVGSRGSTVSVSGATNGRTTAVAYGSGTTKVVTIPQGQPFAGRTSGGATRDAVYGNSYYGSGYPGTTGLGVANRGFPFVFWPLVWGGGFGYGAAYLHDDREYGEPTNTTRPGGPMAQAAFSSNSSTTTPPSTFHIVADNTTVASLIASVRANCTVASNSSTAPSPFTASATDPLPEQAVQYFRASSVALTLDGYNNTAALAGNDSGAAPAPLPAGVDTALLACLNATIGEAVPLFADAAAGLRLPMPSMGLVGLVYVIWTVTSFF